MGGEQAWVVVTSYGGLFRSRGLPLPRTPPYLYTLEVMVLWVVQGYGERSCLVLAIRSFLPIWEFGGLGVFLLFTAMFCFVVPLVLFLQGIM